MNNETPQRAYYSVIPATVRYDDDLPPNAKLLYSEITALCNERGYCWATNEYFAKLYKCTKQSVSSWISKLKEKGYITVEIIYKEGSKEILNRYIKIFEHPMQNFLNTPIQNNLKDNNKDYNITLNNTLNKNHTHTNNIYSEEVCVCVPENLKKLNVLSIRNGVYEIDFKKNFDLMIKDYPKSAGITASKKIIANYLTNGIPNIEGVTFSMISLSVRTYILEWKKSGRDKRYIKDLDNYLKSDDFIDNIIATRETYENGMLLNYGADWRNARFKYKGIDER